MEITERKKTLTWVENNNTVKEENKYFWSSRSVFGIEFIKNEQNPEDTKQIKFLEVKFEDGIINCKRVNYNDEYPLNVGNIREEWVKDLIHALVNPGYMDSRTEKEFYTDFDNVLKQIQNYRH